MNTHRPCFLLALSFIAGELMGHFMPVPIVVWMIGVAFFLCISFLNKRVGILYALILCLGAFMLQNAYRWPLDSVTFLNFKERSSIAMIEGVVDSVPQELQWANGRYYVFDFSVHKVLTKGVWVRKTGKVQLRLYQNKKPAYGDLIHCMGKWHRPFDGNTKGFSYRRYLQDQGIFWVLSVGKKSAFVIKGHDKGNIFIASSIKIRQSFKEVFNRYLDAQEVGVISMMVLGERANVPKELKANFINTGTAHVLAISGMNMAIVTAIIFFILKASAVPRLGQLIGTIAFLACYGFLTGASPSVVRACLMASVILASYIFEQEGEALNSLGLAALVLLLCNPKDIFDIGFQLSFAAVFAILLLYKPCQKMFSYLPVLLAKTMAVSLAAWVGTGPIIFYHFKMITPISILANIPIVPLADLTVALGLGLGVAGFMNVWVAGAFAGCLKVVLNLMFLLAHWFAQLPYGHLIYG